MSVSPTTDGARDGLADLPPAHGAAGGLERRLGLFTAVSIMVASMIGQGIFTTSGYMGHDLRHPAAVLGLWALGGALALAGALSYAELGTLIPRAGGEYVYLRRAFGPFAGFLSGWASFLGGFSAPIAACALVFVECTADFIPDLHPRTGHVLHLVPGGAPIPAGRLVGAAAVLLLTYAHLRRVGVGVRVQNVLTCLKLAVVVLLAAAAFASGRADPSLLAPGDAPALRDGIPLAGRSLLFVMIAYSGWNAATYVAGEVRDPRRVLPRAALLGTLSVAALYLALNLAYFMAIPAGKMEANPDVALLAAEHYFGTAGRRVISFVILVTQLGTISALVLSGSRVYFSMAEDRLAWRALARLSGDGRTPGAAVALQGATGAAMVLLVADFGTLLLYASIILVLFSALTVAALLVLRRRIAAPADAYRAPRGAPLLYIAGCAAILVSGGVFLADMARQLPEFRQVALLAGGSLLLGIPLYLLARWTGTGGGGRFSGP